MPRKKSRAPTVEEVRTMKQQVEDYILKAVKEFELITGVKVDQIDIYRKRKIGFESEEKTFIELITNL